MKNLRIQCSKCLRDRGAGFSTSCPCGGLVEVEYDLSKVDLADSENPYLRFRGLLPIADARLYPADATFTPCQHATRLGAELGLSALYLKDETVLPTGSTKDRMAAVALAYLSERGVRAFCTSSTGNSSTAFAHGLGRFPDLRMVLFTAEEFIARLAHTEAPNVRSFGLRGATFVEAYHAAQQHAERSGLVSEAGFFNPGRREGLKLAFLEACDQVPGSIDWYVQAVSSGMGVVGTMKGADELRSLKRIQRTPRLLCVQQDSCDPMVRAAREGAPQIADHHVVTHPRGIAKAILRGDPRRTYPILRAGIARHGGDFVSVSESEIREAQQMVAELQGIYPCFSASTALAGLVQQARAGRVMPDETVLVNLTGRDRPVKKAHADQEWLTRCQGQWVPETLLRLPEASLRGESA